MTISYSLAPNPFWYISDLTGRPLGGGKMYSFRSLNPTQHKAIYSNPAGTLAWTNPILFPINGQQGPFYFKFDSDNPDDLYFLEVFDADNNLVWTIDHFSAGSGGGAVVTTGIDLINYVSNSQFWRNSGDSVTPLPDFLTICPSNNSGFGGSAIPDIIFSKSNTTANDQITFPLFTPLGSNPLTGDAPVEYYLKYQCLNTPSGETEKKVQFPICLHVQNFSNTEITIKFFGRVNSGATDVVVQLLQFFGDGGGSSTVVTTIDTITLTNTWEPYVLSATVPSVTGKTLGACGNDALYLQIQYPLDLACNIDIAKPGFYLGNIAPDESFQNYDEIDSIISKPRTGDFRLSLNNVVPFGWVPCNDGVLSNGDSMVTYTLPTGISSARNNIDTFPLYDLIWNSVSSTYAPIYDNTGILTTRGSTGIDDFVANKQLQLTKILGRVLAGQNNSFSESVSFTAVGATDIITLSSPLSLPTGTPILVSGGSLPTPLVVNTVYYVIYLSANTLKLAISVDLAQAGTAINLTSDGSGNFVTALGTYLGEGVHTLTTTEMPNHTHTFSNLVNTGGPQILGGAGWVSQTQNTGATGGGLPHNTVQPTTLVNVFLKL
jgi:hypothetical protein